MRIGAEARVTGKVHLLLDLCDYVLASKYAAICEQVESLRFGVEGYAPTGVLLVLDFWRHYFGEPELFPD